MTEYQKMQNGMISHKKRLSIKRTSHKDDKSTSIEVLLFILSKKFHTSLSLSTEEIAELLRLVELEM